MGLGNTIRDLRLRRGLTVQQLADASDLSKGFVSQVETGRTSPSLVSLRALAAALGTSVAHLVTEDETAWHVVRAAARPHLEPGTGAARLEVLSALPPRALELLAVELPPGEPVPIPHESRDGEQCVLCVAGRVELRQGDRAVTLEAGDACHGDGRLLHALRNAGTETARVLVAATPAGIDARRHARSATSGAGPVPAPAPTG